MSETTIAIANLTNKTTALLTEVTIQQGQVVAAATTQAQLAAASATTAATSATAATADANAADAARFLAEAAESAANTSALNAAAVVTGGTATIVPQAGKIPLADSEGIIDADWLPAEITGRNVFAEDQAIGNAKYAASGFVHMGKHLIQSGHTAINQGLLSVDTVVNGIYIGGGLSNPNIVGDSKNSFSTVNIAGIETDLRSVGHRENAPFTSKIKFPDAPNGTVTYDSATGAVVDYTTDTDPKYGDVASTTNEAVARAFEGQVKNGDFRLGDDGSWGTAGQALAFGNGFMELDDRLGDNNYSHRVHQRIDFDFEAGKDYIVTVHILDNHSSNGGGATNNSVKIYDSNSDSSGTASQEFTRNGGATTVKLTFTASGLDTEQLRIYLAGKGGYLKFGSVSIVKSTEEVVTERVDMYGFEGFLEEVTTGNPYVYPNGLIQSQETTMDGANTSASNRPATYYAVFDGDTGSVGKGVNFNATTNANKVKMFSNPKNNLYWIEGSLYQWRVRQRTVTGAGNGDWEGIDSTSSVNGYLVYKEPTYRVGAQGTRDVVLNGANIGNMFGSSESGLTTYHEAPVGAYALRDLGGNVDVAVDGHCYFLVCGTVPRLNQGAFHPSFNPMGTTTCNNSNSDSREWWFTAAIQHLSTATCFRFFSNVNNNVDAGAYSLRGNISSNFSARPDDKFYDAIYASGQGGVIDNRLSAWDKSSPEEASKVDAMVKNGSYRGVEKLKYTTVTPLILDGLSTVENATFALQFKYKNAKVGETVYLQQSDLVTYHAYVVYQLSSGNATIDGSSNGNLFCDRFEGQLLVHVGETNISVSGELTQTDVISDPANILLNPDLKDGWMGSWIPNIPDGVQNTWPFSRKSLVGYSDMLGVRTNNNGQSWDLESSRTFSTVVNSITNLGHPAVRSVMYAYTAFAKQTKVANNEPVFNGEAGIGSVWASKSYAIERGSIFCESLAGTVHTDTGNASAAKTYSVTMFDIKDTHGKLNTHVAALPRHTVFDLSAGINNTTAIKCLNVQVETNQQLGINYNYEQLIYDTDWGDNGSVTLVDGQTTNTDDNGNTVLTGTNTLALPYGWSKNNI